MNLHKLGDESFEFVSRRRFYFCGDEFAVDRFIFRSTIVYQATKHFEVNKSDKTLDGGSTTAGKRSSREFIDQFTRGVVGVDLAKQMNNTDGQLERTVIKLRPSLSIASWGRCVLGSLLASRNHAFSREEKAWRTAYTPLVPEEFFVA